MSEAGRVLQGRYRIDKKIGQGGMGAVYVATDERFGSTVAIKETLYMDDNFRKAIEREARLLNSLKHVALPRVSDHFEEDNGQFLVMEYIPGDDVGTMLESGESEFTVEQIMKWADQLLDALDYLHSQENPVIHRDIKPQNLKITPRGDMILLDFGLAKGNPTDAGNKTASKSIFGYSRNYASLEQIQGTGTDPRSDLYSLAATLYHLLANVGPVDALTRAMAVLSKKTDPLVPANLINPAVPRGIAGVLQKSLSLNADERPASATDMRQMLRESENYAYLADLEQVSATAATIAAFGQETKLMPGNTRADGPHYTDAKTEILPAHLSEVTALHGASVGGPTGTNVIAANFTAVHPSKRRGFGAVAVGLLLLMVGGLIAGGVYMAKPSIFSGQKEADKGADTGVSGAVPTANADAVAASNSNSAQVGISSGRSGNAEAPAKADTSRPSETVTKPAETTKNNKTPATEDDIPDVDLPDVQITQGKRPGDVVITERSSDGTTTRNVFKNGQRPPNSRRPPPDPMNPFPDGFDMKGLTPAQQRRIKTAIRDGMMHPAVPQKTPPD